MLIATEYETRTPGERGTPHLHSMKHFDAQESKVSPSKHLSFEIFQTSDVALHDSITPGQGTSRRHGGIIARDAHRKTLEFRNLGGFCPLEPVGKLLRLTLFQHPPELLS